MNFFHAKPSLADTLCAVIRAEDEHADRYGEDPDPLVRQNALERLAASMAWEAHESGTEATVLGICGCNGFELKVLEVACVIPVQVAVLWRPDGTLAGTWPWDGGVKIWPDEMVAAGLGAIELATMESGISSLPTTTDIEIPWEDGGEQ